MKIYFLSGLPRSGSTVLASILNQNPNLYASTTSGVIDIIGAACSAWENSPSTIAQGSNTKEIYNIIGSIIRARYKDIGKPIIIDKNRGWVNPVVIKTMSEVLGHEVKIIATVRSTADCAASFIRIKNPPDVSEFLRNSPLINHLKSSYAELKNGYDQYPKNILFVDYDDMLQNPNIQMEKINEFLGIDKFDYDFNNIDASVVAEKDEAAWGIANLHKIAPKLARQNNEDSKKVLGHHFDSYDQPKFWIGETREYKKKK